MLLSDWAVSERLKLRVPLSVMAVLPESEPVAPPLPSWRVLPLLIVVAPV